jgi:hypothetical protein
MTAWRRFPVLYEVNAFVWTTELGAARGGPPLMLAEIPDAALDALAERGFDGVWLMGVWRRSAAGRTLALALRDEYRGALPDLRDDDVAGSAYAIAAYEVDPALGGDEALRALRARLAARGLAMMLDFVPNHLARDHAWVAERPELFVAGDDAALAREPHNYFPTPAGADGRARVLAHGRDPYFPGWTDTVQIDHRRADARRAVADALLAVAELCDGVRCDMAMLVTRAVFTRTWGGAFDPPDAELWPDAIRAVRARHPGFLMLAEVYWDLEPALLAMGFDFAYDKRLYDALRAGDDAWAIAARLRDPERYAHFIENHDEARAAAAFGERSLAAAVVALGAPGLRLVHDGQLEGRRLKLPVQLRRRALEPPDASSLAFYAELLAALRRPALHDGSWRLLEPQPGVLAWLWQQGPEAWLLAANLSASAARTRVAVPTGDLDLDLPAFGHRVLRVGAQNVGIGDNGHDD